MIPPPTTDGLYGSGQDFARTAVAAYGHGDARRAALDAGTCLEHLAKACLVRRSPALLADLRRGDHYSLVRLLGLPLLKPTSLRDELRTIGLQEAVERVELFVDHGASKADLAKLYARRNGVVHVGNNHEVELRLMVAFVTLADALLSDLGRPRAEFWVGHEPAVDTLLQEARTQVEQEVAFALATARARRLELYEGLSDELRDTLMLSKEPREVTDNTELIECPSCRLLGVAEGLARVEWEDEYAEDRHGNARHQGTVQFAADNFKCLVCGLRLRSRAHMAAAGMDVDWTVQDVDPYAYDPEGPEWFDYVGQFVAWAERTDPASPDAADHEHARGPRTGDASDA